MTNNFQSFEDINGVKSVIAVSRDNERVVYKSDSLKSVDAVIVSKEMLQTLNLLPRDVFRMEIQYSTGNVLFYTLGEHYLMLYADKTLDEKKFEEDLVSVLTQPVEGPSDTDTAILDSLSDVPATDEQARLLLDSIHDMSAQAIQELGVFVSVNALKEVLEFLIERHECLKSYSVNKDGKISMQSLPETSVADLSRAFAEWAKNFFEKCNDIIPTFPSELAISLVERRRPQLKKIGFYKAWKVAQMAKK